MLTAQVLPAFPESAAPRGSGGRNPAGCRGSGGRSPWDAGGAGGRQLKKVKSYSFPAVRLSAGWIRSTSVVVPALSVLLKVEEAIKLTRGNTTSSWDPNNNEAIL